jgi:hypothetical protein
MRVLSLLVTVFFLLSSFEAWAGYWLAGRWFISSRYATLTLGVVKGWLDRGLISSGTQYAKIFLNRNGKWILLTLGLSQVISEVQQRLQASQYCYQVTNFTTYMSISPSSTPSISFNLNYSPHTNFYSYTFNCTGGITSQGSNPYPLRQYDIYKLPPPGYSGLSYYASIPEPGIYTLTTKDGVRTCTVEIRMTYPLSACGSASTWEDQKRQVPVRVFPNPLDFIRPDVVSQDPSLSWLRDEYNRIASDTSIPTIPSGDLDLPSVDWSIPPDEALDFSSEEGSTREGSREGDTDISFPGLDTSLPTLEKRPFPIELINSLVQNHPLLRILQGINFDVGSSGSCVIGSGVFTFDFCPYAWIFNLMGAIIVPVAFFVGIFGWRND